MTDKTAFDIGASGSEYTQKYGFYDPEKYVFKAKKGLNKEIVQEISWMKSEPEWMRTYRLRALETFYKKALPQWGGNLNDIDFDDIYYFLRATDKSERSWDDVPADIKNTFDRLGIPEAERKFLAGVGAQYECLSGAARVFTARGLVPIRDIQTGDTVFSFDEKNNQIIPSQVRATAAKGERAVFAVCVGTRTIKATANHPFLVLDYQRAPGKQRGRYRRGWKYLHELKPGDLVAVAKKLPETGQTHTLRQPQIKTTVLGRNQSVEYPLDISGRYNPISLPERTSPDLMWWLGLYLGDGFIHHSKGADKARVEFALPESDKPLRAEFARVTSRLLDAPATNGDPNRMTIHSTILARYLEANGFAGNAHTKQIPDWVLTLPQEQILAFLGGYVDADGYVRDAAKNHDVVLTSANEGLLQSVRDLSALCGLPTSTIHRFESKHPFDDTRTTVGYRVQIAGAFERIGCRSPQRTQRMGKRKYHHDYSSAHNTTFRRHTNEFVGFAKIDSITPAGVEPVFDIEVDGPHNFVAEGLIVHNSEVVYHSIKESLSKQGVIFLGMDQALAEQPDIVKKYFGTVIPSADNKFAALNSAVWSGGCLTADARVFTTNPGVKSIAEVREGDTVYALSPEGNLAPAKVLAQVHSGQKPVYRFRAAGRTLEATGNHMFLTLQKSPVSLDRFGRKWSPVWKPLAELQENDIIAIAKQIPSQGQSKSLPPLPKYIKNDHLQSGLRAPTTTNPDLMWLLGVWLGDGNSYKPQPHMCFINFALPISDPTRAETIHIVQELFNYTVQTQNEVSFTVNSKAIGAWLEELGFVGTAKTKRIPGWVYGLPLEERLACLGGLLDTDGWIENEGKTFAIELANHQLIEDIKLLAISCGLFSDGKIRSRNRQAAFFKREQRYIVSGDSHTCRITGNVALVGARNPNHRAALDGAEKHTFDKYTTVTGENFSALSTDDIGFAPIREKEYIGVRDVYDIQVDGFANFVANGIIAHNSFIYVPPGVRVEMPLQAYFRINARSMGQFERTLIIADEGSYVHYVEGCTAPTYSSDSLHSAVVEIIINKGARVRYTTIQNWSANVYNLVTKRAVAYEDATMEWVDCNLGCLEQGSTVTTPEGIKPIEQLEVGEKVLSYDEHSGQLCFHRVLAKRFSGNQPVRTVSIGERKLRVTANHPFYSYAYDADAPKKLGRYHLAYVRADHLEQAIVPRASLDYGKPYRLQQPSLITQFNSRNQYAEGLVMTRERESRLTDTQYTTDDMMWLFGYWLGDGNIEFKEGKTDGVVRWAKVGFSTPATDRARDRLMSTMAMVIDAPPFERADGVHVSWLSKELAEFFRLNGFEGGARVKRVPTWVWSLPESQRLACIAGYLDADGYMLEPRSLAARSAHRALLEDIASLLVTLGITPRLYTEFDQPRLVTIMGIECVAHGAYRLVFPQDERLLPHLSPALRQRVEQCQPASLKYHRSIDRSNIELPETVEVVQVQVSEPSSESVPTWDIEVEGTGNFISQGFIVHNSKLTMKYPSVYMMGKGAHGELLSVAFAGKGQHQDAGGKVVHAAPHTSSLITSKSISKDGGRTSYRGLLKVYPGAIGSKSNVRCDALLLDEDSRSDTYPYIQVDEDNVSIGHEASVSKIGEEQLFYLMSRGLSESEAATMIVSGFIEPIVKELPMEFAVEMNRLIQLQMEGSVG